MHDDDIYSISACEQNYMCLFEKKVVILSKYIFLRFGGCGGVNRTEGTVYILRVSLCKLVNDNITQTVRVKTLR